MRTTCFSGRAVASLAGGQDIKPLFRLWNSSLKISFVRVSVRRAPHMFKARPSTTLLGWSMPLNQH